MNPMPSFRSFPATVCRWTGRLLSLLTIGTLLLFMIGEGFNPLHFKARELLLAACFPLGLLLGLALAWRWEKLGGTLTIASLAAFYLIHYVGSGRFPRGPFFALLVLPGLFFLLAGLAAKRKAEAANP
jgi:hypothetical protein